MIYPQIEVMPDPIRGWLARNSRPEGWTGWWPATDEQGCALDCPADILLLGGSDGSLKTSTILVDLCQERDYARMNSYFFRRTYPELEDAMQQARDLFPLTGAMSRDDGREYVWPSGAHFRFRHLSHEKNLAENQGKAMSAVGVDESTHIPMDWIRYLFTRNRSTDPNLAIRMRLGTNPGNVSSMDHMQIFFNGVCPHCEPQKAPPQGVVRTDGKWHDGTRMEMPELNYKISIAHILSSVRDHSLLGDGYVARLYMQRPATAKALLDGCWRAFEGQYFDLWDPAIHVIKAQEFQDHWWLAHWIGGDFGYAGSAAAAVLLCRTEPILPRWPNGRVVIVEEYPRVIQRGPREPVKVFTQNVYDMMIKKRQGQEQARRIEAMYLGVDSWNDRGDLHTLADQMNEVLEPKGLGWQKARDDRAGAAQLAYAMLKSEELIVSDACPNTISCLESRLRDPDEPMKVLKEPSDPLDDVFDAGIRHGLYSHHQASMKPVEMRIDERVTQMWKQDPVQAMFRAQQIAYEERQKESGDSGYYGGNIRQRLAQEARKNQR